jgi:hypothetical protein
MKKLIRNYCARILSHFIKRFAYDPKYFELWQECGYHVIPTHFYSAVPDTREIKESVFDSKTEMIGINITNLIQLDLLNCITSYKSEYSGFPSSRDANHPRFFFGNSSFESVDAEVLYGILRHFKPKQMIEIGSGFSTLLAMDAFTKNAAEGSPGKMTAIEPFPPEFLTRSSSTSIDLVVKKVQDVPLSVFESLNSGDVLFIDSSHVCKIGSDVVYEFLEILPRLQPGVLVHIHDIFLPKDYPRQWVMEWHRFWNEQYLLQAFLCGNQDFEVLWAGAWMNIHAPAKLAEAFSSYQPGVTSPASFWIRRRAIVSDDRKQAG